MGEWGGGAGESGPQGKARCPAADREDQCTRHRACRQAVTKNDSSYMAQEWNILRRFYFKGTRNANLKVEVRGGAQEEHTQIGLPGAGK